MKVKIKQVSNGIIIDVDKQLSVYQHKELLEEAFDTRRMLWHLLDAMGIYFSRKNIHLEIRVVDHDGNELEEDGKKTYT